MDLLGTWACADPAEGQAGVNRQRLRDSPEQVKLGQFLE